MPVFGSRRQCLSLSLFHASLYVNFFLFFFLYFYKHYVLCTIAVFQLMSSEVTFSGGSFSLPLLRHSAFSDLVILYLEHISIFRASFRARSLSAQQGQYLYIELLAGCGKTQLCFGGALLEFFFNIFLLFHTQTYPSQNLLLFHT